MEEFKKFSDGFSGIYRGKVVDNNDPEKYGRIKVQVYPMLATVKTEDLPWAVPAYPIFEGSGNSIGYFSVPDNNTFVFVFFENGDIYQPVYFAEAPTKNKGLPGERLTNYPNRKVLKTSSGFLIFIDDTARMIRIEHPRGSFILVDSVGKITVNSVNDVDVIGNNIDVVGNIVKLIGNTQVSINPIT